MRTIKFRAWDNKEKKWLLGYEYPNLGGFSIFGEMMMMGEWSSILSSYFPGRLEDIELMQFTGLLDRNGKEIYEGDIIKEPDTPNREVTFNAGSFMCTMDDGQRYFPHSGRREVIGNIYENPELLS